LRVSLSRWALLALEEAAIATIKATMAIVPKKTTEQPRIGLVIR
jgi:hypothetical protein